MLQRLPLLLGDEVTGHVSIQALVRPVCMGFWDAAPQRADMGPETFESPAKRLGASDGWGVREGELRAFHVGSAVDYAACALSIPR